MPYADVIEKPGMWRVVGVLVGPALAVLPCLPLLSEIGRGGGSLGGGFPTALASSARVAASVLAVSLAAGWPLGVVCALHRVRGGSFLLALVSLPILVPSFLWAIGWSMLAPGLLVGAPACVLVHCAAGVPMVLLASRASASSLTATQVDSARLAGGDAAAFQQACHHAAVPALLAATLAAVLTLSDPGPGLIFGLRTAASEVLTSFSAVYDFNLAARQCLVLVAVVLAIAVPVACFAAPRLAASVLARQVAGQRKLVGGTAGGAAALALMILAAIGTLAPLAGLLSPLRRAEYLRSACEDVARTAGDTLLYASGSGALSVCVALVVVLSAGRSDRLRAVCLGAGLSLFAVPPSMPALGIVRMTADAPRWADPLLRGRAIVCLALGVRFLPVAITLLLRAWASTSPSWGQAAGLHGVGLCTYLARVALPALRAAGAAAMLLVALLATSDVGTTLLLHPAGRPSLPLAVFTVMSNAPQGRVAALCLAYVVVSVAVLLLLRAVGRRIPS